MGLARGRKAPLVRTDCLMVSIESRAYRKPDSAVDHLRTTDPDDSPIMAPLIQRSSPFHWPEARPFPFAERRPSGGRTKDCVFIRRKGPLAADSTHIADESVADMSRAPRAYKAAQRSGHGPLQLPVRLHPPQSPRRAYSHHRKSPQITQHHPYPVHYIPTMGLMPFYKPKPLPSVSSAANPFPWAKSNPWAKLNISFAGGFFKTAHGRPVDENGQYRPLAVQDLHCHFVHGLKPRSLDNPTRSPFQIRESLNVILRVV